MRRDFRTTAAIALTVSSLGVAGCGGGRQQTTSNGDVGANTPAATTTATPSADTMAQPHHSKLAGAAVGGVVGHALGGHAVAGAAAGALVQHYRNKHYK